MRRAIVLVVMLSMGCTSVFTRQRTTGVRPGTAKMPGDERTTKPAPAPSVATGTSTKRVKAKEEPATLVADDRARCVVTEQRFRDTSVGDLVACAWTN
jgi:hypothetical protein